MRILPVAMLVVLAGGACSITHNFGSSTPRIPTGPCNHLPLGPAVQPTEVTDTYPPPAGGAVPAGRFDLTSFALYRGEAPPGSWPPRAISLVFAGTSVQLVSRTGREAPSHATYHVHAQGEGLTLSRTCGEWTPDVLGFDATPDQVRLHLRVPGGFGIWTLTRHGTPVAPTTTSTADAAVDVPADTPVEGPSE